jgi:hypothetical protein
MNSRPSTRGKICSTEEQSEVELFASVVKCEDVVTVFQIQSRLTNILQGGRRRLEAAEPIAEDELWPSICAW